MFSFFPGLCLNVFLLFFPLSPIIFGSVYVWQVIWLRDKEEKEGEFRGLVPEEGWRRRFYKGEEKGRMVI